MKEYIMSLVCAAIASGIIGLVFQGNETLGKYARLSLSVCLIASLIPASVSGFEKLKNQIPNTENIYKNDVYLSEITDSYDRYIIEDARQKMCSKLKLLIFEKSGIMPDSVRIEFNTSVNEEQIDVSIKSVEVFSSELSENQEIKEYVYQLTKVKPQMIKISETEQNEHT